MVYTLQIRKEIDVALLDGLVNELVKANGKDLFIEINSMGGDPNAGIAIFSEIRRYAAKHDAHITTRAAGYVASTATLPFLAGDRRIVNEFLQPFIHEPYYAWNEAETANDFKKGFEDLEQTKQSMADFYSRNTLMTKEQALDIMAADTWMNPQECIDLGFATEIEVLSRKQAKLAASIFNLNNKQMSKEEKSPWWVRFSAMASAQKKKAELTLTGVAEETVVFPELDDEATPSVGDAVVVNDDANFSGSVETPEYLIVAADGVVTELVDKNEIDPEEVIEELMSIIEEKDATIATMKADLDKTKRLYNAIGGKEKPSIERGKKEKEDTEGKNPKVSAAFEKIKNRKNTKK